MTGVTSSTHLAAPGDMQQPLAGGGCAESEHRRDSVPCERPLVWWEQSWADAESFQSWAHAV